MVTMGQVVFLTGFSHRIQYQGCFWVISPKKSPDTQESLINATLVAQNQAFQQHLKNLNQFFHQALQEQQHQFIKLLQSLHATFEEFLNNQCKSKQNSNPTLFQPPKQPCFFTTISMSWHPTQEGLPVNIQSVWHHCGTVPDALMLTNRNRNTTPPHHSYHHHYWYLVLQHAYFYSTTSTMTIATSQSWYDTTICTY